MRAVRSLRSIRVRSYVLPVLLGALVLRFLIPAGFMPASGEGMTLTVAMCSAAEDQKETLKIPGVSAKPRCDHCTAPSLASPLAPINYRNFTAFTQLPLLPADESQIPEVPLARAQIPRAPPLT
jgi:hypothetical protein